MSDKAAKAMRHEIRGWNLKRRNRYDLEIAFNSQLKIDTAGLGKTVLFLDAAVFYTQLRFWHNVSF